MKQLIALAALIVPLYAHAWSFETGSGATLYQTENGRWYQNGPYDSHVAKIAPEYSLGVVGNLTSRGAWGVDWHLDYVNLGSASASCQCDTSDGDYAARATKHTAQFNGSGRAQGFVASVEPYRWYGGWRVAAEIGAFAYHSNWSETVTGWTVSDAPPQNLYLHASGWHVAPVVGVSVGDAAWSVSYRHYFMRMNSARQNVPPMWNDADVIEIKRRF